jgi:hypothetical protein
MGRVQIAPVDVVEIVDGLEGFGVSVGRHSLTVLPSLILISFSCSHLSLCCEGSRKEC